MVAEVSEVPEAVADIPEENVISMMPDLPASLTNEGDEEMYGRQWTMEDVLEVVDKVRQHLGEIPTRAQYESYVKEHEEKWPHWATIYERLGLKGTWAAQLEEYRRKMQLEGKILSDKTVLAEVCMPEFRKKPAGRPEIPREELLDGLLVIWRSFGGIPSMGKIDEYIGGDGRYIPTSSILSRRLGPKATWERQLAEYTKEKGLDGPKMPGEG